MTRTKNILSLCTVKLGAHIVPRSVPGYLVADISRLAFVAEFLDGQSAATHTQKAGTKVILFGLQVKGLFRKLKVDFTAVELDEVGKL